MPPVLERGRGNDCVGALFRNTSSSAAFDASRPSGEPAVTSGDDTRGEVGVAARIGFVCTRGSVCSADVVFIDVDVDRFDVSGVSGAICCD